MKSRRPLPGDKASLSTIESMIRVDHAGEYGAKRIYEGQLSVLKNSAAAETIRHMAAQEQSHLDFFDQEIVRRQIRPTLLHPLWHIAGFALGAATALLGEKAAMACTEAVEEVIDNHYARQIDQLKTTDPQLGASIETFRQEEAEHRAMASNAGAHEAPAYTALSAAIKLGCQLAIWTAERI